MLNQQLGIVIKRMTTEDLHSWSSLDIYTESLAIEMGKDIKQVTIYRLLDH